MPELEPERPEQSPPSLSRNGSEAVAPRGPIGYLREAIRIARFDGDAIARASHDRQALIYGGCVVAIGALAGYIGGLLVSSQVATNAPTPTWLHVIVGAPVAVFEQLLVVAINVGLLHGAAKLMFGATGTYVAVLRVVSLSFIVYWLSIIPIVGALVAGVWSLLIMLVTFEEVDGVERLQALTLVIGFAAITLLINLLL